MSCMASPAWFATVVKRSEVAPDTGSLALYRAWYSFAPTISLSSLHCRVIPTKRLQVVQAQLPSLAQYHSRFARQTEQLVGVPPLPSLVWLQVTPVISVASPSTVHDSPHGLQRQMFVEALHSLFFPLLRTDSLAHLPCGSFRLVGSSVSQCSGKLLGCELLVWDRLRSSSRTVYHFSPESDVSGLRSTGDGLLLVAEERDDNGGKTVTKSDCCCTGTWRQFNPRISSSEGDLTSMMTGPRNSTFGEKPVVWNISCSSACGTVQEDLYHL
jgi:hypothetical protein